MTRPPLTTLAHITRHREFTARRLPWSMNAERRVFAPLKS